MRRKWQRKSGVKNEEAREGGITRERTGREVVKDTRKQGGVGGRSKRDWTGRGQEKGRELEINNGKGKEELYKEKRKPPHGRGRSKEKERKLKRGERERERENLLMGDELRSGKSRCRLKL